jgi:hypothetical protein
VRYTVKSPLFVSGKVGDVVEIDPAGPINVRALVRAGALEPFVEPEPKKSKRSRRP